MSARRVLALAALAVAPVLAGCVGDTDLATHVRAHQAQFNAHGHTNNGPATYWWEYSTRRTTLAGGGGTKTPTRGPVSSPNQNDVSLNELVKNLDSDQVYFYRACGKDTKAGSSTTCGRILEFDTAPADSTVTYDSSSGGSYHFVGAAGFGHRVHIVDLPSSTVIYDALAYPGEDDQYGSAITPTANCPTYNFTGSTADSGYDPVHHDIAVECSPTHAYTRLDGSSKDDILEGDARPVELHGGDGADLLETGTGDGNLYGDAGADRLYGYDGTDFLIGGAGEDELDCGGGTDYAYVDSATEHSYAAAHGCESITDSSPSGARAFRRAMRAHGVPR